MSPPRHAVVGLGGHVDHGKTSLVRALTGAPGDRLPEEKRRGVTLELGFARWELPGHSVSVIDVPGHERFVRAMVAGASGFDLLLLVVAADDGVMPQTREHLAIAEELGVRAGVVVLTKCDLADPDMLALLEDEIQETTRGTFLEGAPVVTTSVRAERGLDALAQAVVDGLRSLRAAPASGPPWLAIDRVFTKQGFGTVVTGTLSRGSIAEGDALDLLPALGGEVERVVVRGLSIHGGAVGRARATTRLALNLRGLERDRALRGAVLTAPGWQRPTCAIDVELHVLPDARRLDPRADHVLHVGSGHVTVRARALYGALPLPGERGLARLRAEVPFAVHAGQRFVVRRPELGAHRTVAGGIVLDPHPGDTKTRKRPAPAAWLRATADPHERVLGMIEASAGGLGVRALAERLPPDTDLDAALGRAISAGELQVTTAGGERRLSSPAHLERARAATREALAGFHAERPALSGATAAELESRLASALRPLAALARMALVDTGDVVPLGDRVALASHDPGATRDRVAEAFRTAQLEPGSDEAVRERTALPARTFREIVAELVRGGRLVRLATGLHVHAEPVEALALRVRAHFDAHETLSPGDFKALSGLTRKNAILLLEHLDRVGVTRRQGDHRVRG